MIRGVQVGSVTNVVLQFNPKDLSLRIPVYADFDPEKVARISGKVFEGEERAAMFKMLIDHGLRAQLEMQSVLTGLLMVNLDFLPNTPATLVGADPKQFEIPTVPTALEALTDKLQKLPIEETFTKLANAVSGIEKVVNAPELERGVKDLSRSVDEMRKLIKSINDEIKPLSAGVQETLKDTRNFIKNADGLIGDAQKLVQNVDRQVGPLAARVEGTLDGAQKLVGEVKGEVGPLASDLKKTLEDTRMTLAQVQKTLQAAEGNYVEGSAFYYELTEALEGLNEASRSINLLGEYLKRHPDSVLWGKGKPGGK
jgi:paraquat-inducible protein B